MAILKLQSAMEYLMTYGWALLIIAIVIVALFSIGIFNGSPLGTTCNANPGYTCQITQFQSSSGNLIVIIGQSTGTQWITANVAFVNQSLISSVQSTGLTSSIPQNSVAFAGGLSSGVTSTVYLPVTAPNGAKVGSGITGAIWVSYTTETTGTGSSIQTQIATVTAKST